MNNSNTLLIKATVFTLTAGLATSTIANTSQAQEQTIQASNHWKTLSLGGCAVQFNQTGQQQAFLYCKGAPNKVATAILNTQGLEQNQLERIQCHTSLNARQINCFTPGIRHAITIRHVAQVAAFSQCRTINWEQDQYNQYQLIGHSCALSKSEYSKVSSIISLTDFVAQTVELHNPVIVSYNGELMLDHGNNYDDQNDCFDTSDTSMDDDPDGKTSMDDDPDDKTSMDDDPDGKTSMDDDPDGKTSMDDDPDLNSCSITSDTSMDDDPDGKTSMDDDPDQD